MAALDPTDADGDGITGDICEVHWDNGYIAEEGRTGVQNKSENCKRPKRAPFQDY